MTIFRKSREDLENKITYKIDMIFERVQEILGMYKANGKIRIYAFSGKSELHQAYYKIYHQPCRFRAFYIDEFKSAYINVNDVNDGVLGHEITHFIVNRYLLARPPAPTAEILAKHVNRYLFR